MQESADVYRFVTAQKSCCAIEAMKKVGPMAAAGASGGSGVVLQCGESLGPSPKWPQPLFPDFKLLHILQ